VLFCPKGKRTITASAAFGRPANEADLSLLA